MPLQNRVTPDMKIVAEKWRGGFMGNRGGRIHDPETKTLLRRKWASKRWIICVTEFKQRQRVLMGHSYTELFFLDEVSALAAGHRPCFECRRSDANAFAEAWIKTYGKPEGSLADAIDKRLHDERTGDPVFINKEETDRLTDGAMIKIENKSFAKKQGQFLHWSGGGYKPARLPEGTIQLLTPLSVLQTLKNGFKPQWHGSAQ